MRNYPKGIALAERALQLARQRFGARAQQTLTSLNTLGLLYRAQGRYGEAKSFYRDALQARREVLGLRHSDTLTSVNNLAVLYQYQGRYGEAEPLYREALEARREVLGPRHPDTLRRCRRWRRNSWRSVRSRPQRRLEQGTRQAGRPEEKPER